MHIAYKNIYKIIAYGFLTIVLLVALLLAIALSPLGVSLMVNLANEEEGISIDGVSGSFYSHVNVQTIKVNNTQLDLDIKNVSLDIGLNCLFVGEACVDNLSLDNINITLKPSAEEQESEASKAYIELPILATLTQLSVGKLNVYTLSKKQERHQLVGLQNLSLDASMQKKLSVQKLSIDSIDYYLNVPSENVSVQAQASGTEHWIEQINNFQYSPIAIPDIFIPINATINSLTLAKICVHQTSVVCTNSTQAKLAINKQKLSATLASDPVEQLLAKVSIDAKLDLAAKFKHQINLVLQPNLKHTSEFAKILAVKADGNVDKTELSIVNNEQNTNIMQVKAQVALDKSNLPINISIQGQQLAATVNAWFRDLELPFSRINTAVKGSLENYDFTLDVDATQQNIVNLDVIGSASLSQKMLRVERLHTSGKVGSLLISGQAQINQGPQSDNSLLALSTKASFQQLQLQHLVEKVESDVDGEISLNAKMSPDRLWGDLLCKPIKGQLQTFEFTMSCDINIDKKGRMNINALNVKQGPNSIEGKGFLQLPQGLNIESLSQKIDEAALSQNAQLTQNPYVEDINSDLVINVELNSLKDLYPDAEGRVVGNIQVKGKGSTPNIYSTLDLSNISFNDLTIRSSQLNANIDIANNWKSDITATINELSTNTRLAEDASIELQGDLNQHQLSVDLKHPDYTISQTVTGGLVKDSKEPTWKGTWDKGRIDTAFDSIELVPNSTNSQTDIKLSANDASISAHCWQSTKRPIIRLADDTEQTPGLCIDELRYVNDMLAAQGQVNYDLAYPLQHFVQDIFQQGTSLPLKSDLTVNYSKAKGLEANAYSFISESTVVTSGYKIDVVAIVANFALDEQVLTSSFFAGTQATGAFGLRSQLVLDQENRRHSGQLQIDDFKLNILQRFIPGIEELNGQVVGNLSFDGELTQPLLNGGLDIQNAQVVIDNYPYPITSFNQQILVEDNVANINGEFDLGDGSAEYWSTLSFVDHLIVEGGLKGVGMQLAYEKNELIASPDLVFSLNPEKLSLSGEVIVPNADIKIQELPESAQSPSSDTIILGEAPPEPILPIGLDINIKVLLDPPKLKRVNIEALDLKASLGSDLQVVVKQQKRKNGEGFTPMQTLVYGSVTTLSGSYEAYGQNLQVREGNIYFSGPPELPQFDITAIRNPLLTNDSVVAGIRISGNPVVPKVELFSEPAMIQARQLSYLILGTDIDGGSGERDSNDTMLINALVNAGIGNTENGINKLGRNLGFDSLALQTAGSGTKTQVQVTGRISEDIQVTYGVGLFDQTTEVILKYQLLPKLYLEAKSGTNSAVDLFYEFTRSDSPD